MPARRSPLPRPHRRRGAPRPGHRAGRRPGPALRRTGAVVLACAGLLLGAAPALAAPPPDPLPWTRNYIADVPLTPAEATAEVIAACQADHERGVFDNGAAGQLRYGVVGDSVENQTRAPALADLAYRWTYLTHCGENLGTVQTSGRLGDVLATTPDVLVGGFGTNNFSTNWMPDPTLYSAFVANFGSFLGATDGVPCRVLFNVPDRIVDYASGDAKVQWQQMITGANQLFATIDPVAHPNVIVVDWNGITHLIPGLLVDDQHLTRAGINARINLALGASRRCFGPDNPVGVHAVAGNAAATVWWDPLPPEEGITTYTVTASTGKVVTTSQPTVNVAGLANGVPVSFTVTATNAKGTSAVSLPSETVTPAATGARFHPMAPLRVVDTRNGTGGRWVPLGPTQSMQVALAGVLPPEAAGASAVVLNVTATGQTAASFVTVWPGGQSRPLTSNLNPRPGIAAIPAMVTTRTGPNASIQLYNQSGTVDLIADVIGWYDAPGLTTGALFTPVAPIRVLDTRDGTGGKATPFGAKETATLTLAPLPAGASAAVVNVTATNTTAASFVTLYPAGTSAPNASNLNPQPGITRANLTAVKVDGSNRITIFNNSASTDLIIDVVGYYGTAGAVSGGAEYYPITPERHYDTRDGTGGLTGPMSNAFTTTMVFAGRQSIPGGAGATAIDANITVVGPTAAGHTTVWPFGPKPNASVLNYGASEVVPNRDIIGLNNGMTAVWSAAPFIHYVVDVAGYFGPML